MGLVGGKRVSNPDSKNASEQTWRDPVGKRPQTPSRSANDLPDKAEASRTDESRAIERAVGGA